MPGQKRVLILTSKTGGGHISLAEALRDLLETGMPMAGGEREKDTLYPDALSVEIVDPQPGFFHQHYRFVSRKALWLWAAEFQFFDAPRRAILAHRVFTRLIRHRLHTLLDKAQPDLVVTTYPFLTYEVMRVMERRASPVPLAMLFSDAQSVHAAWLTERQASATFATTHETYEQALAAGFAPERLHLVGWPVRAQFSQAYLLSREMQKETLKRLNLAPRRFTIFLQGGSEGAARVNRTLENILTMRDLTNDLQVILAAGTNRNLVERYKNVPGVAILPHAKEIAPYMAAADVIMGKAGPNILFESVMLGKPFIATTYIPGQEQANLSFISHHGLGWIALQREEQQAFLTRLIHDSDQLKAMSTTINTYRQWNAAATERLVPLIRSLIDQ